MRILDCRDRILMVENGRAEQTGSRWFHRSLQALLFITVLCVFVALSPEMPRSGADPSWQLGINQAVAQGLAFGHDIVFTYGPYASVYLKNYHPATDHLMLAGSIYLGLLYGIALLLVARDSRWYHLAALLLVLTGLMYVRWPAYFSYPLLVGILCFKWTDVPRRDSPGASGGVAVLLLLLFSPFGLLPLTKGTLIMLCAAVAGLAFLLFVVSRKWVWAAAVAVSTLGSLTGFWLYSGQSLTDLPRYFLAMAPLVSGYSEAMSSSGSGREILCYLGVAGLLLCALLTQRGPQLLRRLFLCGVFFVYLFVAFKSGFVRHASNAVAAATALLIASLLYGMVFRSRWSPGLLLLSALAWIYIDGHVRNSSLESVARRIAATYASAWDGVMLRSEGTASLEKRFRSALDRIHRQESFPRFAGTTDIYSYHQAYLIASGNHWNPRPVLQSYAAFTPELARRNNNHLLGEQAPDNLVLRIEPVDRRIPASEDGPSWLTILSHYRPSELKNGFLYLHQRDELPIQSQSLTLIDRATHTFGEVVPVPPGYPLVFAQISFNKTLPGRLASLLYKPSELALDIVLENGVDRTFRLVPGMAEAGFLLSPLIEDTVQFGRLYGDTASLSDKQVQSFSITLAGGGAWHWETQFEVAYMAVTPPPPMDIATLYRFDDILDATMGQAVTVADSCEANIDAVNGTAPAPGHFTATEFLTVEGWMALSARKGLLPDAVLVVLQDPSGANTFIRTRKTPHRWAGNHFSNPKLAMSGYAAIADVSGITGHYALGLAYVKDGRITLCPEFSIPGTLEGKPGD